MAERDSDFEDLTKKLNWDLSLGFEARLRIPYRRLLFWGAAMGGLGARHSVYGYTGRGTSNETVNTSTAALSVVGLGLGLDVFITPRVAVGVSSWLYGAGYWFIARRHVDSDDSDQTEITGAIHWTLYAGVRIYLGRLVR
jgi:hypothetical protein